MTQSARSAIADGGAVTRDAPVTAARAGSCLADELVDELARFGIDTYFGVPGGAIEPLLNAISRQRALGRVRFIGMRSEAGAAFAADGHFRASGRMAVCTATTGPGIANLLTATMAAHADRIPILLVTPQVALAKEGRGALQDSSPDGHDLPRILGECTRYSTTVSHPDQLAHKLSRALSLAQTPPYGPVHLAVPSDLLAAAGAERARSGAPKLPLSQPLDRVALDELCAKAIAARFPLFYVGDDAGPLGRRLWRLARTLGGAVVSSPAGKRWIGHLDPTYRGVLGFSGHPDARQALDRADVVIAFGATFDELSTNAWSLLTDVPLYAVDRHAEFACRLPNAQPVVASPSDALEELLRRLPTAPTISHYPRASGALRIMHRGAGGPVHPSHLMQWLSQVLPDDVVVHVEAGNSFSWSTRDLLRPMPDTYRVAMGLSTMCWAISAVIGAAIASPRRSICICGDGSMLMSSLELTVAVQHRLPVTYIVLNDAGLGMVRHGQRLGGAESIGHEIPDVRFDHLAQACGARGYRVEAAEDLERLPVEWLSDDTGGPALIDVCIDREAVPPMADRVRGLARGVAR